MTKVAASQAIAERSMNQFWEGYESGIMEPSVELMRNLGYTSLTLDYVFNPDSYYFPNRRGQRFVKPKNIDADRIPVLGIKNDKKFRLPSAHSLHSRQKEVLVESGHTEEEVKEIEVIFGSLSRNVAQLGYQSDSASVFFRRLQAADLPDKGRNLSYGTKPSILLHLDEDFPDKPLCPTAHLHELVHIAQSLEHPSFGEYKPLDKELEAYAVQAKLSLSAPMDYLSGFLCKAIAVDQFRKNNLGKDVYTSTPEFEQQVREKWPQLLA